MQLPILAALTIAGLLLFGSHNAKPLHASDTPPTRVPVIVELFTSEGCSSCPPADALLRKLEEQQPVPNAEIIVLGEHVDYWNYIGWTDRFSSKQFTQRQGQYVRAFNLDSAYTPQMVVNGERELNGADESAAKQAIAGMAKLARVPVNVAVAGANGGTAMISVEVAASPLTKNAEVFLAITESGLATEVKKGENDGRTLRHAGVVHVLKTIGEPKGAAFFAKPTVKLEGQWNLFTLRAVAFVEEKNSRRIIGAAAVKLSEAK